MLRPQPPQVFSIRGLRLYLPKLEPCVAQSFRSPAVPPSLSMGECGAAGSASGHTACPVCPTICQSLGLAALLRVPSAPPTGLDKCFFFISLVVGLPCGSIFCQFWLVFVFKSLLFFRLCEEAQCVYLHLHLGQKSFSSF